MMTRCILAFVIGILTLYQPIYGYPDNISKIMNKINNISGTPGKVNEKIEQVNMPNG